MCKKAAVRLKLSWIFILYEIQSFSSKIRGLNSIYELSLQLSSQISRQLVPNKSTTQLLFCIRAWFVSLAFKCLQLNVNTMVAKISNTETVNFKSTFSNGEYNTIMTLLFAIDFSTKSYLFFFQAMNTKYKKHEFWMLPSMKWDCEKEIWISTPKKTKDWNSFLFFELTTATTATITSVTQLMFESCGVFS